MFKTICHRTTCCEPISRTNKLRSQAPTLPILLSKVNVWSDSRAGLNKWSVGRVTKRRLGRRSPCGARLASRGEPARGEPGYLGGLANGGAARPAAARGDGGGAGEGGASVPVWDAPLRRGPRALSGAGAEPAPPRSVARVLHSAPRRTLGHRLTRAQAVRNPRQGGGAGGPGQGRRPQAPCLNPQTAPGRVR